MHFVDNQQNTDPSLNLAQEEFLLRQVSRIGGPLIFFYINEPAVIIGRNQNTLEEIDPEYIEAQGIQVVRRLSGGGAVYHDLGNLNFSFITAGREDLHNFAKFTEPVVTVLNRLGVPAELRLKSDIFVEDRKISGNAQYSTVNSMFSHGTLLFDTDLEVMLKSLNPRQVRIESRAVQSVRNFVVNIQELLPAQIDIEVLKQAILEEIFAPKPVATYQLTAEDWQAVEKLADERYRNWDWNYGQSPKFNVRQSEKLSVGKVDLRIDVEDGIIQNMVFYGDFSGHRPVQELADLLAGTRYERQALAERLADVEIEPYFGPLAKEDLLALLY